MSRTRTLKLVSTEAPADEADEPEEHDPHLATPSGKPRARSLGLRYRGTPGRYNAITDVPGVEVGCQTLVKDTHVRTGVTAIHPRGKGNPGDPVAAGFHSLNGNGEMTGVSWIEESGTFEGPIAITNTHAVGTAHAGHRCAAVPQSVQGSRATQATEEAVANSLTANKEMTGIGGHRFPALPTDRGCPDCGEAHIA